MPLTPGTPSSAQEIAAQWAPRFKAIAADPSLSPEARLQLLVRLLEQCEQTVKTPKEG